MFVYCSGKIFPSGIAADSYKKAVESAMQKLKKSEADSCYGGGDVTKAAESSSYVSFSLSL